MQFGGNESFDHEPLAKGSSDRSFGLVFTAFFVLLGLWPMVHNRPVRIWALGLSLPFLLSAVAFPGVLGALNASWTQLGKLLAKVTNPLITGLMFYLIFAPTGVILRLLGNDLLRMKYDRGAGTYWIRRASAGLGSESMRNQF
jgi:hypothetical protein